MGQKLIACIISMLAKLGLLIEDMLYPQHAGSLPNFSASEHASPYHLSQTMSTDSLISTTSLITKSIVWYAWYISEFRFCSLLLSCFTVLCPLCKTTTATIFRKFINADFKPVVLFLFSWSHFSFLLAGRDTDLARSWHTSRWQHIPTGILMSPSNGAAQPNWFCTDPWDCAFSSPERGHPELAPRHLLQKYHRKMFCNSILFEWSTVARHARRIDTDCMSNKAVCYILGVV